MNLLLFVHGALHLFPQFEWFSVRYPFAAKTIQTLALVALFFTVHKIRLLRTFERVVALAAYRRLLKRLLYRQRRRFQ
jgi:hypothetical protein